MPIACFEVGDEIVVDDPERSFHDERGAVIEIACREQCCAEHGGLFSIELSSGERHFGIRGNLLRDAAPKPFYLVAILDKMINGNPLPEKEIVPVPGEPGFATGKQAAERADELTKLLGYKVQPRRVEADANDDRWRKREEHRLVDGIYEPLPKGWDLSPIPDHFLHVSSDDPTKVAYTETPALGVVDRQTRTTPGRYLERFYPHLSEVVRKHYIALVDRPQTVLFASTADEIEWVYVNGPRSCMSGGVDRWGNNLPAHPSRVYAGPDLALAYLKDGDRATARGLVWPEKKLYWRLYGDMARLRVALEDLGYRDAYDTDQSDFEGARLSKIMIDPDRAMYLMPYIDGIGRVTDPDPEDPDCWLFLNENGNVSSSDGGVGWGLVTCPKTGRQARGNDFNFVHGVNEMWSYRAREEFAAVILDEETGQEAWWPLDMLTETADGRYVPTAELEQMTFISQGDGRRYHNRQRTKWRDGRIVSGREIDRSWFCAGNYLRYLACDPSKTSRWTGERYSLEYLTGEAARRNISVDALWVEIETKEDARYTGEALLPPSYNKVSISNVKSALLTKYVGSGGTSRPVNAGVIEW